MQINEGAFLAVKNYIKEFEHTFQATNGRKPNKDDIYTSPKVLKYYKIYWKLKSYSGDRTIESQKTTTNIDNNIDNNSTVVVDKVQTNDNLINDCKTTVTAQQQTTTTSTTTAAISALKTWNNKLNKSSNNRSNGTDGSKQSPYFDEKQKLLSLPKVKKLNEEYYREDIVKQSNKQLSYSLRYKQKKIEEKSFELSKELKELAAELKKKQQDEEDYEELQTSLGFETLSKNSETSETPILSIESFPVSVPKPKKTIQSNSEPIEPPKSKPTKPTTTQIELTAEQILKQLSGEPDPGSFLPAIEVDDDFGLDNLNEFIKNSIILENDSMYQNKGSVVDRLSLNGGGDSNGNKKRIFAIDDDSCMSISKRFKSTNQPTNQYDAYDFEDDVDFDDNLKKKNINSVIAPNKLTDITNIQQPVVTTTSNGNSKRKFFKSKIHYESNGNSTIGSGTMINDPILNYDANSFFDHHKELDFDPLVYDCSLLNSNQIVTKNPIEEHPVEDQVDNDDVERDEDYVPNDNTTTKKKVPKSSGSSASKPSSENPKPKTNKKKASVGNYRKLNIKKKICVRGYRKFNMKQYKFKSWKKNKNYKKSDNKCFKCGEPDHFANECTNIPSRNAVEETMASVSGADSIMLESLEPGSAGASNEDGGLFNVCLNQPLFTDLDDPELDQLLDETLVEFGFEQFRPNQKFTVKRILCGYSTLLISPTGFGKSLCYQLAAYCFWKRKHLITLVISPLISLMQDQLINFPECLKPVCFNSSQSDKEKQNSINAIIHGQAQVLFLSPECIVNGLHSINFQAFSRIAFVCIDEAHCLAEWSNNFRPSYLHLYKILRYKLNIKTVLALSATVTKEISKIVCRNLGLRPREDVVGCTKVPDNLVLTVSKEQNKLTAVVKLLENEPFKSLKSIIIYCTKREQTEQLESYIRISLQFNVDPKKIKSLVRAYHAGLGSYERTNIQNNFIQGKLRIVVATIAFGMGINKKDIKGIIHYNMPKSFENYIQEIGRAGRDGNPAYCHLFLDNDGEDLFGLQSYIYANGTDRPSIRKLVQKIYPPCKCRLLAEVSAEDEEDDNQISQSINCPGHPVALPIIQTEVEIDIKSENIYTLLICLEQNWLNSPIQVLPPTNSMCSVVNFGDKQDIGRVLRDNAILHMGAMIAKQECGTIDFENFKFSIVKVANMMGMQPNFVKAKLKQLEWFTDPETGRRRKSHLSVRFSDYSYYCRTPGTLENDQLEEVIDYLSETIHKNECKEIFKLRYVYSKFTEFVIDFGENDRTNDDNSLIRNNSSCLKQFMDHYFQSELTTEELINSGAATSLSLPFTFNPKGQDLASMSITIHEFINQYYEHGVNTPRKVARILQGISSPKFPAEIWGKVYRFWRSLPKIDHNDLIELCREVLVSNYNISTTSKKHGSNNTNKQTQIFE